MTLSMRVRRSKWKMRIERGMSYEQRIAEWKPNCIEFGVVMRTAQRASGVPFLGESPKRGND